MTKKMFLVPILLTVLAYSAGAEDIAFEDISARIEAVKAAGASVATVPTPVRPGLSAAAPTSGVAREWLVMVFINGRNNLWPSAIRDVNEMEMVGTTDKVAVTVELGLLSDEGASARFAVVKDTSTAAGKRGDRIISPVVRMPGSDMGSWRYFVDFAKWSYRNYPAKKVLVILWNHGSGRIDIGGADNTGAELGISYDDQTRNFIRNKQIGMALAEISRAIGRKVDIYASDACLMQMASVVYEVKDQADYVVGSEEIVPGPGYPYDTILTALNQNPGMDGGTLSKTIVEKFQKFYNASRSSNEAGDNTTLSAIRTVFLGTFTELLNDWVRAAAVESNRKKIMEAEKEALAFEDGYRGNDNMYNARSRDLYDLVDKVNKRADKGSKLYLKGEALKSYLVTRLVIANRNTRQRSSDTKEVAAQSSANMRAKGLAVYFPAMIYDTSYDENLFARDSLWDDFIKWKLDPGYAVK